MATVELSQPKFRSKAWVRVLIVLARVGLGSFFAYAAIAKLYFHGHWHLGDYHFFFAMAIDSYKMLPISVAQWMAKVLPWLELSLGALLIVGTAARWVGSLTTGLLLIFMAVLIHAWILHLEIICGCTGGNETVPAALARDSGLLLLALIVTADAFFRVRHQSAPSS